jgi:serine protease
MRLALLPWLAACAVSSGVPAPRPPAGPSAATTPQPGLLVVDLVDGTPLDAARALPGLAALEWSSARSADESLGALAVPDLAAAHAALDGEPLVESAEPAQLYEASAHPNDPLWPAQWNLRSIGAPAGWRVGGGAGVVVAVIDTGIAPVPDLADSHVLPAISFVPDEPSGLDTNGHGTHVAGTIAQSTHNGLGVAGVAPAATLLPIQALSGRGFGRSDWIASAIDEAADNGAHIINLSLGGPPAAVIATAVAKAQARGVLVVAAAGNTGRAGISHPAALDGVLAVGAVGPSDARAPYSTTGPELDLVAPGGDTREDGGGILQDTIAEGGGHAFRAFQGTSMATPHVSGAAAVIWHAAGGDPARVAAALMDNAADLGPAGHDEATGHGRLDLGRVVKALFLVRNGVLFALGALVAALVMGLGGVRRVAPVLAGAWAAGGLFFLPLLPLPPVQPVVLLSRPLLDWPGLLVPEPFGRNPLLLSAFLPVVLTFLLGTTRTLGPWVGGASAGLSVGFAAAAVGVGPAIWLLPGGAGTAWHALQAALCLVCAVATAGVARARERQEAGHR